MSNWFGGVARSGKYNAQKTVFEGRTFDSKREAEVAMEIGFKKKAGLIREVEFQKVFELLPKPNRITYRADFFITFADGRVEAWDVKGFETQVFTLKAKMFRHFFPDIPLVTVR